jgi:hypothetical protein
MQIVNNLPESELEPGVASSDVAGLTASVEAFPGTVEFCGALAGEGKLQARDTAINTTSGQVYRKVDWCISEEAQEIVWDNVPMCTGQESASVKELCIRLPGRKMI